MSLVIQARDLSKRFYLRHNRVGSVKERFLGLFHTDKREVREEFWALRDLSLDIEQGEAVGIIGSNGSGKSTLLKLIAGIHRPTRGTVRLQAGASVGTMIELGIGFHPELSGRENVFLSASVHGLSRDAIEAMYASLVAYSGLEQFIDQPLKNYSSGMQMRLGFSISVHLQPDVLLLDEVFAVGDVDFQQRCVRTMREFQEQRKTILFVSHADTSVREICRRACLLDHGRLQFDGSVDGAFAAYDRLRAARTPVPVVTAPAEAPAPQMPRETADAPWHRRTVAGDWDASGLRQLAFLRAQGLLPDQYLLDVGCGALCGGTHLIAYLNPGHYYGVDSDAELVRAAIEHEMPRAGLDPGRAHFAVNADFTFIDLPRFDMAFAHDLFPHLSLNLIARCITSVVRQLKPGGSFFVSYWAQDDAADGDPVIRPGGVATSLQQPPYHYSFALLRGVAEAAGARAERFGSDTASGLDVLRLTAAAS